MGTDTVRRPSRPAPDGWVPSPPMAKWLASQPAGDGLPCLFPQDVADVSGLAGRPITVRTVIQDASNGRRHRRLHSHSPPSDLPAPAGRAPRGRGWSLSYWWPWQIDPDWLNRRRRRPAGHQPRRLTPRTRLRRTHDRQR